MNNILTANKENFKKYNFEQSLENRMEVLVKRADYRSVIETLNKHIESCINSLMHFGNAETARLMLKNIYDLVNYKCLPFHKCKYYYKASKEIENVSNGLYSSKEQCIDMMFVCVEIVIHQYGIKME
ncbi:hypothetical protein MOF14_12725 [Bacillus spizizenii]|nr:hypothetical protein [Bacillus spizizenii]